MSSIFVSHSLRSGIRAASLRSCNFFLSPEHGRAVRLTFRIEEGPDLGRMVTRIIESNPTPTSPDGRFLAKLLGRALIPGEGIDLDIAKRFWANVRTNASGGARVVSVSPRPLA
jgi:hypothetical protein